MGGGSSTGWSRGRTAVCSRSGTGRTGGGCTVGSGSCTSWGTAIRTTVTASVGRSTAAGRSAAAVAAWRLDVRAAALIRVNRRAARLDDYGFTASRCARRGAVGLRGTTAPRQTTQQPGVRQAGHAHRSEHGTSHLDPSHRTKSPSLGILEPGSSRPMERRCWSAEEFQAAFLCRLRRASQFKRLLPASRPGQLRPSNVRPTSDCFGVHCLSGPCPLTALAAITLGTLRQSHLAGLNQWIGAAGTTP